MCLKELKKTKEKKDYLTFRTEVICVECLYFYDKFLCWCRSCRSCRLCFKSILFSVRIIFGTKKNHQVEYGIDVNIF